MATLPTRTFLYAAKDEAINHAVVLVDYLARPAAGYRRQARERSIATGPAAWTDVLTVPSIRGLWPIDLTERDDRGSELRSRQRAAVRQGRAQLCYLPSDERQRRAPEIGRIGRERLTCGSAALSGSPPPG